MSRTKLFVSLITVLLLGAAAVGGYGLWQQRTQQARGEQFRTEQLDRGEIVQIISANGTVNPVVMVNVGTQVSGTLQKIHVDFNAQVREGQILAELDPRLLQAQVDQDEANLASGQANLKLQQANWKRLKTLYEQEYISRADFDAATQAREAAEAQVALQQAQLRRSRTNLSYTIIRSPVSGIVVSRLVDVGQTVAASFQTPVLFQIAKDLGQMQIDTSVAEADLGNVHLGQEVSFYVDAFPDHRFVGEVKQIRLNPTTQQNVVTYNVVVAVDNPAGKLSPGMTAYASLIVSRKPDVVRLPNAALRFRPPAEKEQEPQGRGARSAAGAVVYRLQDGKPVAVPIKTGSSDGRYTELVEGALTAGESVIVGLKRPAAESGSDGGTRRMF